MVTNNDIALSQSIELNCYDQLVLINTFLSLSLSLARGILVMFPVLESIQFWVANNNVDDLAIWPCLLY